jgi:hypothetical protein
VPQPATDDPAAVLRAKLDAVRARHHSPAWASPEPASVVVQVPREVADFCNACLAHLPAVLEELAKLRERVADDELEF